MYPLMENENIDDFGDFDNESPALAPELQAPPEADPAELQRKYDVAQAELAKLKPLSDLVGEDPQAVEDIKRGLAAVRMGFTPDTSSAQAAPASQEISPRDKQALLQRFAQDPLEFVAEISRAAADDAVRRNIAPYAVSQTDLKVDSFVSRKANNDKYFDHVKPEFEKLLSTVPRQQLANLRREELDALLDNIYYSAKGRVVERAQSRNAEVRSKERERAPMYSGGINAPSAKSSPPVWDQDEVAFLRSQGVSQKFLESLADIPEDV